MDHLKQSQDQEAAVLIKEKRSRKECFVLRWISGFGGWREWLHDVRPGLAPRPVRRSSLHLKRFRSGCRG